MFVRREDAACTVTLSVVAPNAESESSRLFRLSGVVKSLKSS